jgi:dTDP-4-dehydrorhamnose 3,5-epimerase
LRVEPQEPEGLALIHWDVSTDERGGFARIFCREDFAAAGIDFLPVQANLSRNPVRHTLRGLHFQAAPHEEAKIVTCLRGAVWDVAVDMRPGSPTFGKWRGFELAAGREAALHIPAGFAQGFITLAPDSELLYLMGTAYRSAAAAGIRWDDPQLANARPAAPELLSPGDAALPSWEEVRAQRG